MLSQRTAVRARRVCSTLWDLFVALLVLSPSDHGEGRTKDQFWRGKKEGLKQRAKCEWQWLLFYFENNGSLSVHRVTLWSCCLLVMLERYHERERIKVEWKSVNNCLWNLGLKITEDSIFEKESTYNSCQRLCNIYFLIIVLFDAGLNRWSQKVKFVISLNSWPHVYSSLLKYSPEYCPQLSLIHNIYLKNKIKMLWSVSTFGRLNC